MKEGRSIQTILVAGLFGLVIALLVLIADARNDLERLYERIERIECRHVMYEDGSSVHEDAELVRQRCTEFGR